MVGAREKGKIPHGEWPKIVARYHAGETIAQIGRSYGCTPPAIRYIVKRSGSALKGQEGQLPAPTRGASQDRSSRPTDTVERGRAEQFAASGIGRVTPGRATGNDLLGAELRTRVSSDVASFLVALDQVVIDGSAASLADLQDATDRLMRSTARTRLELERLLNRQVSAGGDESRRKATGARPHQDA